jgi:hypothetical protein
MALPIFILFGALIAFLVGAIFYGRGSFPPLNILLLITLLGLPVGAYYGMVFALRSRGYSFRDYVRSIKNFLNNT